MMPGCRARRRRTRDVTRTGPGAGGRCGRSRRSWLIPGIRGGRCGTGSRRRRSWSIRPTPGSGTSRCSGGTCPRAGSSPSIPRTRRWSAKPTSSPRRTPLRRAARPGPRSRRYLLAGLIACGRCGRRLESAWSYGRPAYRCRHGYASATVPDPARPKNTYVREDQILPHLAALAILLAGPAGKPVRGSRGPGAADRPGRHGSAHRPAARRRHRPHLRPGWPDPARRRSRRAGGHHRHGRRRHPLTPGQGKEDRLGRSGKRAPAAAGG